MAIFLTHLMLFTTAAASAISNYTQHAHTNCYTGNGGVPVDPDGTPLSSKSVAECADACSAAAQCHAFTVQSATAAGDCWLRKTIDFDKCKSNQPYDTWVTSAPPSPPPSTNLTCVGNESMACPPWAPSELHPSECTSGACDNCYACLEEFYFASVAGLPQGMGFASRDAGMKTDGAQRLTLTGNVRAYLVNTTSKEAPTSWSDVALVKLDLTQHTLAMSVDLSGVGCACNAAAYLVDMAPESEYLPPSARGVGPVYCDVQGPTGTSIVNASRAQLCIEDDLIEGNVKAFQSTLHTAFTHPGPGKGPDCDGCDQWGWKSCANGVGTYVDDRYGRGASIIDSGRPFEVVASFDAAASKFVGLRQGDTSLGVWNATFTKDGDCAGDAVPRACYKTLANTFEVDGLAMVISLWKDEATKMDWLNGPCDAAYPECVLGAAAYVITRLEISDGAQSFEADTYGTCRLNIPWQCCYDPGLGACTVPGDGSQYCYMSAHNCLVDCGGGEFCHCDDTVHGVGCEPGWFVPGAEGTDKHGNVTCNTKPPGMASSAFDGASSATYAISGAPCYTGRAEYGKKMCV